MAYASEDALAALDEAAAAWNRNFTQEIKP
jgi:hypothetical protein